MTKQPLAKVTAELAGDRGPDVRSRITVPASWLSQGGQLLVTRPRRVTCEKCGGGGCATCDNRGGFGFGDELQSEPVTVCISPHDASSVFTVRLPHLGVRRETDAAAGHWLLDVHPAPAFSPGVSPVSTPTWKSARFSQLKWKILLMLLVLTAFWGWLTWT